MLDHNKRREHENIWLNFPVRGLLCIISCAAIILAIVLKFNISKIPKDSLQHFASTDVYLIYISMSVRMLPFCTTTALGARKIFMGGTWDIVQKSICLRIQKFNEIENRLIIFSSVYSPVLVIHNPSTFFIARPTSVIQKASFFPDGCGVC